MEYIVLLTASLAFVLYLNTLDAGFAYDDSRAIQKNQDLRPETPIRDLFYDDFWGTPLTHSGSHKSYRPLCVLSFRLNYYFGSLSPWGYHLGNVLLHTAVTAVFTWLAKLLMKEVFPSLLAGLIFAAHPVHSEAVAGVVGRADVGACLFYLFAILAYMRYVKLREDAACDWPLRRMLMFCVCALCTSASMLTKETGVTVIAVCAVFDMFVYHKVPVEHVITFKWVRLKGLREGIFLLASVAVMLITFRMTFMGNKPPEFAPSDNPASDSPSLLTRTLTFLLLPVLNVWMLLCPRVLSFDWSMQAVPLVESVSDPRIVFILCFYSALIYLCHSVIQSLRSDFLENCALTMTEAKSFSDNNGCVSFTTKSTNNNHYCNGKMACNKKDNTVHLDTKQSFQEGDVPLSSRDLYIMSLSLLAFPFLPASNLFFYVGFVLAERVLYIPSMGFALLLAHVMDTAFKRRLGPGPHRRAFMAGVMGMLILFCAKTLLRNRVWYSEENLYKSGLDVNPAKAWGNYANILNDQGRIADAEQAYRNALLHRSNMADTHYNLGILLQNQGRYREAMESYQNAIRFRPKLSMAYLNLGIVYCLLGQSDEASKVYRQCADLDTSGLRDPRAHESAKISALYNLAKLFLEENKLKESIDTFLEAVQRRPSYYAPQSLYNMLGEAYMKAGVLDKAEHWYREALRTKPDHIPAHITMAKLLHQKKDIKGAEEWFQKARNIDPEDVNIFNHHAQLLAEEGRLQEAAAEYKKALTKTSTEDFDLIFNAANTLRQINENDKAEELYKKAVKLKPNFPSAHMNLGAMLHMRGKLREAEASYLEALRLKPQDHITQQNLIKLRKLMKQEQP